MSTPPPGPQIPPCQSWISADDLSALCGAPVDTNAQAQYATVAVEASMLAYELSGRQFSGLCGPVTVRPCRSPCTNWFGPTGGWSWSWGYWSGDWGFGWAWGNDQGGRLCSCGYDSYVELAGYPVREVTQVKIGGSVLPAVFMDGSPQYRLDQWRYLTRLSDPDDPDFPLFWPRCQRLDLEDDQPGTWSVSFTFGVDPPPLGLEAAKALGCQMLLALSGKPCQLPSNASRIVKQGVTVERITPLAQMLRSGSTGIFMLDSFLAAYNPSGLRRRPSVFSPDMPFPVRTGNQ